MGWRLIFVLILCGSLFPTVHAHSMWQSKGKAHHENRVGTLLYDVAAGGWQNQILQATNPCVTHCRERSAFTQARLQEALSGTPRQDFLRAPPHPTTKFFLLSQHRSIVAAGRRCNLCGANRAPKSLRPSSHTHLRKYQYCWRFVEVHQQQLAAIKMGVRV